MMTPLQAHSQTPVYYGLHSRVCCGSLWALRPKQSTAKCSREVLLLPDACIVVNAITASQVEETLAEIGATRKVF